MRDLSAAYTARSAEQALGWAELPVPLSIHAMAARAVGGLDDSHSPIAARLGLLADALAGIPERLRLPPIGPTRSLRISAGAKVWQSIGRRSCSGKCAVAREHNANGFMVIQAALAVLLSTISASPRWRSGSRSPISGHSALDELVGFFVDALVLRIDIAGSPLRSC